MTQASDLGTIANLAGAAYRAAVNNNVKAIASQNAGASAPSPTYPGLPWWDTTNSLIKFRNDTNTAWVTVAYYNGTTFIPYLSGAALDVIATRKSALSQTIDPTANNDSSGGYAVGSFWVNVQQDKAFICVDASVGGAVWTQIGGDGQASSVSGIRGLRLSNSSTAPNTTINIAPGSIPTHDKTSSITLSSTLSKRINASWQSGSGNGGLDTGSLASSTWYSKWLIQRPDTGAVDALFSRSTTSPVMPSNYTLRARLGWVYSNGSGVIDQFRQDGDYFYWWNGLIQYFGTPQVSPSGDLIVLRAPPLTRPMFSASGTAGSARNLLITSPDLQNNIAATTVYTLKVFGSSVPTVEMLPPVFVTDSSSRLRFRGSDAVNLFLNVHGWVDHREQGV